MEFQIHPDSPDSTILFNSSRVYGFQLSSVLTCLGFRWGDTHDHQRLLWCSHPDPETEVLSQCPPPPIVKYRTPAFVNVNQYRHAFPWWSRSLHKKKSVTHRRPSGTAASHISLFFFSFPACRLSWDVFPLVDIYAPNMKYKSRKARSLRANKWKYHFWISLDGPKCQMRAQHSAKQLGSARYKTLSITARPASHLSKEAWGRAGTNGLTSTSR